MKCKNCGMEFEGNFCPNCGTPSTPPATEEPQPLNENNESSSDGQPHAATNNGPSPNDQQDYSYVQLPNYQMTQQKEKWYQKSWVVVLFLLFIWPVGLFLMWKYKRNWTKIAKIIITVLIALCVLYSCSTMGDTDTDTGSETTTLSEDTNDETTDITEEKKELESISAAYTGSSEEGTVLDSNNTGITVTATYDDGSTETITDFTISNPVSLTAEQSSTVTIEYEGKTCDLVVQCTTISPESYKAQCQSIAYDELARTPDSYIGQNLTFTGEIIQVQESGTDATYRINVTQGDYGIWDDTVLCTFDLSNSSSRFLENDIVTFYGTYAGLYTYTSVMGADITVPSVIIQYMDLAQ